MKLEALRAMRTQTQKQMNLKEGSAVKDELPHVLAWRVTVVKIMVDGNPPS